jgi:endonuclease/exonuclease/phosphatase family metal-dependent hydrolase
MPSYNDLNPQGFLGQEWAADESGRIRTVERLLALRAGLNDQDDGIPPRAMNTLLIGTWNIREFDSANWGARLPESYAYIAEIVDRFDLVAVQEVREDLRALERLMDRLGHHWSYLVSDVTDVALTAGNGERLAFLFDTRKVRFLGQTGELVLPPLRVTTRDAKGKKSTTTVPAKQAARTPLMAAFQVGWTKFVLTTVHIVWGDDEADPTDRVEEIGQIARFIKDRSETPSEPIHNFVVLGDFNIFSGSDETMRALEVGGGFTIPDAIKRADGSNIKRDRKYDQIVFRNRPERFEHTGRAGVFDTYKYVMTSADEPAYRPYIDRYIGARHAEGKKTPKPPKDQKAAVTQYNAWRTHQMSDHLPLWAEFRVDFADTYLNEIRLPAQP